MRSILSRLALAMALLCPVMLSAQDVPPLGPPPAGSPPPVRIFLDCPTYRCDPDFFRTEFPFADFVRSPEDADVQVLVTTVGTGGGGGEYTVTALGRKRFQGWADTLKTYTTADATDDDRRRAIAQRVGLALARYVALSPVADRFTLKYTAPDSEQAARTQRTRDPWDYWAFRARANIYLNGEQSYTSSDLYTSIGASRITSALKIESNFYRSKDRSEYEIDDSTTFVSESESYGTTLRVTPSLGRHWSYTGYVEVSRSTYQNQALDLEFLGGLEYNIWPYEEVTRRLLTLQAVTGVKHFKYDEVTLYGETAETRPVASLETTLDVTQPWGSIGASFEASTYLHDLSKHQLELNGNIDIRIARGLSLSMHGYVASIHDQLFLPAGDASDEEVLLRQRQLATNYSYFTSVGLSYNFGSRYNNVVNPRFR